LSKVFAEPEEELAAFCTVPVAVHTNSTFTVHT
jgi:hypothetical protein